MHVLSKEADLVGCPLFLAPRGEQIRLLDGANTIPSADNLSTMWQTLAPDTTQYRLSNIALSLAAVHLWMRHRGGITPDTVDCCLADEALCLNCEKLSNPCEILIRGFESHPHTCCECW
ncbi:unnamed protein product [Echinostoma caproni]|uniref:Glycosyltransferase n=1 Tax=Echinostoma caproni TaxID=27848 RepID=A0A183BCQ9_9TREM|nr:unnamed protein product [Echinostoma caproni]